MTPKIVALDNYEIERRQIHVPLGKVSWIGKLTFTLFHQHSQLNMKCHIAVIHNVCLKKSTTQGLVGDASSLVCIPVDSM